MKTFLTADGLNISRRTVAKYRDRLGIPPPASARKYKEADRIPGRLS